MRFPDRIERTVPIAHPPEKVWAEPGERRRVRYRLRSAPMQVAQQFLASLARDWEGPLDALKDHLDRTARDPATTLIHETRGHHG